jgi:3-methyladenine DNA glycosylase AlkD
VPAKSVQTHDVDQVMAQLEALGDPKIAAIYARHGAKGPSFRLRFSDLGKLAKTLRTDHELARRLWRTGNVDARQLACMVVDPEQADARLLEQWARELDWYGIADTFAKHVVSKSALAPQLAKEWIERDHEWTEQAGWDVWSWRFMTDPTMTEEDGAAMLKRIERDIHDAKNRVRYAMNNTLITIGMKSDALESKAIAAAARIGDVEVDHGETGCKTPNAVTYIPKARAHARKKGK